MALFINSIDWLQARFSDITEPMLVTLIALAAVAWWRARRAVAGPPHAIEPQVADFCPHCGRSRSDDRLGPLPKTKTQPVTDAMVAACAPASKAAVLPSTLLRKGWTRSAGLDKEGRIMFPSHESAVAWSLWGAANRALEPYSREWRAWYRCAEELLTERHGGMNIQAYNRASGTTHAAIIAFAEEAEKRAGLPYPSSS